MYRPFLLLAAFFLAGFAARAIDLGPMSWTPRADWINVKNPAAIVDLKDYKPAVGDGTADDTDALQAILHYLEKHDNGAYLTVYFPPGTYKITKTLVLNHVPNVSLIGCGSDTKLSWAGPSGGAMYWPQGVNNMRYVGLTWLGNNLAAVAYEECSYGYYSGGLRHENESFHDFTAPATYQFQDSKGNLINSPAPPSAAIVSGYPAGLTGETQIFNCVFINCGTGIVEAYNIGNFFCWFIEGCEFEKCGIGINLYTGGGNSIVNCHFDHCTTADILGGGDTHIRRCTSVGGGYFFADPGSDGNPLDANIIEDCWIDGWSNAAYAIDFHRSGPTMVFDCTFTHPPDKASSPILSNSLNIESHLTLSNNYAPGLPAGVTMVQVKGPSLIDDVPQGMRFAALPLTSPAQIFIHTTVPPGSAKIFDVSQPPYRAMWTKPAGQNGIWDIGAAIQAAVNDAKKAGGGATAYIPTGLFNLSQTIDISGSNYTVEGNGFSSMLCWWGPKGGTMFAVDSPDNLHVQFLRFAALDDTINEIKETATKPGSVVYDGIHIGGFSTGNPGAGAGIGDPPGLVLSNLPAGSTVLMPHLDGELTVDNCGPAKILVKYFANPGRFTVSGTAPKTGFLGTIFTEGGGQVKGAYNVVADDNQDFVFGDYYVEQCYNDVELLRGKGTGTGRVTIQGFNSFIGSNAGGDNPSMYTVNVDNYAGRLFYGGGMIGNWNNQYPASINQTGANPIDMILMANSYSKGVKYTVGPSATLISTQNINMDPYPGRNIADEPHAPTPAENLSIAQGIDHLRELEAVDMEMEFGLKTDGPPVAQYSFEGNAVEMATNQSGMSQDVSYVPGLGAQAADFNGTSSYIDIPNPVHGTFSIAMWIRTGDTGGRGKGHGLVSTGDFYLALNGGKFCFAMGGPALASSAPVADNAWHHVAVTHDAATGANQIYVDGKLDQSGTSASAKNATARILRLGAINGGGSASFYKGAIDQLQIFDYVLSTNDVAVLCNRTKDSLPQ